MKNHFLLTILLIHISSIIVFGQKKKIPPPPPPISTFVNSNCVKLTNINFTDRLKNYPFNKTTQIQFVSFENNTDSSIILNLRKNGIIDSLEEKIYAIYVDSLPRINDTICYSKLFEIKSLTFSQVNKLTDIIYNYGFNKRSVHSTKFTCFEPRNAILFLDTNGKVFEFIEVCFHCNQIKSSNDNFSMGEMCDQKMDMLRSLFKDVGIKQGVITE